MLSNHVAYADNDDLKAELAKLQKELTDLTGRIDAKSGPEFKVKRDVEAKVSTDVVQHWASHISTPNYTITAVATRVEGDLFYQGGVYKVWIRNPADTNAFVRLNPITTHAGTNALSAQTSLVAHAETRVFASAGGITTNILCETQPDVMSTVAATFALQQASSGQVNYVLNLTQPATLNVRAVCHLGGLGDFPITFPIHDLARELSRGTFDLGYKSQFQFQIPTSPVTTITLPLATRNPSLTIDAKAIKLLTDVDVGQGTRGRGKAQEVRSTVVTPH
jgi:hypothetical protein